MAIRTRTLLGSIVVAALASGCMTGPSDHDRARTELASQRALFEQAGLTSYVFTERQSCFCDPDSTMAMRLTVTDGSLTGAVFVADQRTVPETIRGQLLTIPQLFDLIDTQLEDGTNTVTVTYDGALHYPAMASSSSRIPDSGLAVYVSDVVSAP